jgi:hypothetical protein
VSAVPPGDRDITERAEAALAAAAPIEAPLVRELLAELRAARALSDERWLAISKLAPAAKTQRGRAHDLARLALEAATALRALDPDLATRLDTAARATLPQP